MQELYGKLNTVTQQINYSGGSTNTATVAVDNKIKKLTTNVLRVPQSLTIKRKDQVDELFDGSAATTIDLTDTASSGDLPTVIDLTQFAPEPSPSPEPAQELPYTVTVNERTGKYYIDTYTGSSSVLTLPTTCSIEDNVVVEGVDYTITGITSNAFAGNDTLLSIVIPEGYTSLGISAFAGCSNLQSVSIPSTITMLSKSVFAGCISLTSLVLPAVRTIPQDAFTGSGIVSITLGYADDVVTIRDTESLAGATIYVPASLLNEYQVAYSTLTFVAISE